MQSPDTEGREQTSAAYRFRVRKADFPVVSIGRQRCPPPIGVQKMTGDARPAHRRHRAGG